MHQKADMVPKEFTLYKINNYYYLLFINLLQFFLQSLFLQSNLPSGVSHYSHCVRIGKDWRQFAFLSQAFFNLNFISFSKLICNYCSISSLNSMTVYYSFKF